MILDMKFKESNQSFGLRFSEIHEVSDGGYELGYNAGYEIGKVDGDIQGYDRGYVDGLATRTYETWTITYADGSTEEKEVALL